MNPASEAGAFFDLDGTLLPAPSIERRFLRDALGRGKLGPSQMMAWLARFFQTIAMDPPAAIQGNKAHFAAMPASAAADWEARLRTEPLRFFSRGLRLLEWHAARGHRIFLVTGAPAPLAEIAVRQLPVPVEIMATQLEAREGCWTGGISGEPMSGTAKRRAIRQISAKARVDLTRCFAYGDSYSDVAMLEAVAYPTIVNPGERLERLARQRGWPILEWHATETRVAAAPLCESRESSLGCAKPASMVHPSYGESR
jgi:HAD superfamily hydrolase (TIGR01490 family)